ncbi:acetyl/propionyl/methylcrotonyl-CoA carboxylase subunit alpha [Ottowia sp. VDI28]|uniref:acetyl/propionyl/methylcrotonyl-CoA carboxylase subunit alpha n=1 Tax=Ottowia sp. VDI28 TaxID=3133968 RepID=UPI003C2CD5FF
MRKFETILIANRGEIAIRVMRAARALGYRTVAVYSDPDAAAPHVGYADTAVAIGEAAPSASYLNIERLIGAAKASGAQAVHPGYGFLSENARFAQACADNGLVFIGPSPNAIRWMGDKAGARRRMAEAGVPCVPGYDGEDQSEATLLKEAGRIGMPLMVKAAAGGGGRGMRLVNQLEEVPHALKSARAEAQNAFGSGALILERAVQRPRHVEIQVFGDSLGNVVHMGERDCSVQRRHQKVIEESPCPVMTPELRARMGAAAVAAARAIDYVGAGTVEFLLDQENNYYFLEMNTRIQVEHPVTEAVTGIDLVQLQIQAAEGLGLGLTQEDVNLTGHAIEARLYAEDVAAGFLPSTGQIECWQRPSGPGIRCDDGIEQGMVVSPYYDPMLAKIIASGPTRDVARARLIEALKASIIIGPHSNRDFLIDTLEKSTFVNGGATTAFIAEEFPQSKWQPAEVSDHALAMAGMLLYLHRRDRWLEKCIGVPPELLDWSSDGIKYSRFNLAGRDIVVRPAGVQAYEIVLGEKTLFQIARVRREGFKASLSLNGIDRSVLHVCADHNQIYISHDGHGHHLKDKLAGERLGTDAASGGNVPAPMHGVILDLFVSAGQKVEKGTRLAVLEAMKMQHDIVAAQAGEISEILCEKGKQVASGALLFKVAATESPEVAA